MFLKLCWILQLCFRQFKKDIGLANQSIEERSSDMRKAIASQDMSRVQKVQSKLEMATSARKRASEKLETLIKKKKQNCYFNLLLQLELLYIELLMYGVPGIIPKICFLQLRRQKLLPKKFAKELYPPNSLFWSIFLYIIWGGYHLSRYFWYSGHLLTIINDDDCSGHFQLTSFAK